MKYNFEATALFEKEFKILFKKYPSLKSDIEKLREDISENSVIGNDLGRRI